MTGAFYQNVLVKLKKKKIFMHRQSRFDNTSDMHGNIKALEYAINLNLTHYIPGHGPTGDANHAVKPFLDYLLIIQDEVEKGYRVK